MYVWTRAPWTLAAKQSGHFTGEISCQLRSVTGLQYSESRVSDSLREGRALEEPRASAPGLCVTKWKVYLGFCFKLVTCDCITDY